LPHRHWLWGIDIQNDAYVDSAQIAYFKRAGTLMKRDDRLILVLGEAELDRTSRIPTPTAISSSSSASSCPTVSTRS
jgi:hypothetical protein